MSKIFFATGVRFPLYHEIFYIITTMILQRESDHCGRCRIGTRATASEALPLSHHITTV